MVRRPGNRQLKAARLAGGYGSQDALSDALNAAAGELGLRGVNIGPRQVRRWESTNPPWPQAHHQQLLLHVLGLSLSELGFVAPWDQDEGVPADPYGSTSPRRARVRVRSRVPGAGHDQPPTIAVDFAAIVAAHRRMYWSVNPTQLHPAVVEHTRLGEALLRETSGIVRTSLARALAESGLLVGRMEFFDLGQPEAAAESLVRALQFAGEADDQLLGSAILAHSAFVPGWSGDREGTTERMAAARAYARRGPASPDQMAWLDAVEAECMTRCGDTGTALNLINRAESTVAAGGEKPPEWFDWFSAARLAAFKGNTQLKAGQLRRARDTLSRALDELAGTDVKQRAVILGDLAAVEVAAEDAPAACQRAVEALNNLSTVWYAAGMERIREVRRGLRPWQGEPCVRELDDRLYGWETTVSAIRS